MKLIVDADPIVYGCGFAAQGEPVAHALNLTKMQLQKYMEIFGSTDLSVHLTGSRQLQIRPNMYPSYKKKRLKAAKPEHYDAIREYLLQYWKAVKHDYIEADDAVCLEAYDCKKYSLWRPDESAQEYDEMIPQCVIISIDKDLDQVPGWHYKPNKELYYYVDHYSAGLMWGLQMLMGDDGDDIKGLPDIGPAKAKKFLLDMRDDFEIEHIVNQTLHVYEDRMGESYLEDWQKTCHLVSILQDHDQHNELLRDFNEATDC